VLPRDGTWVRAWDGMWARGAGDASGGGRPPERPHASHANKIKNRLVVLKQPLSLCNAFFIVGSGFVSGETTASSTGDYKFF
jgi:hypothetical protein